MVSFIGCRDNTGDPIAAPPPVDETPLTKDDSVLAHAYLVRDAAEEYKAAAGFLAKNTYTPISDSDSRTLVDFLPSGELLINPYSGGGDTPLPHEAWLPGEVSYIAFGGSPPRGYLITGIGAEEGEPIVEILYDPANP